MRIKDGSTGRSATVNASNRLITQAVTTPFFASAARDGDMYLLGLPFMNVTTTEGLMAWIYNNSTNIAIMIERITFYSDGGSTTYNKPLYTKIQAGVTQPTTNITPYASGNTNTLSGNSSSLSVLIWDGVGTGMTGHTPGLTIGYEVWSQGYGEILLGGGFIIGPGVSFGLLAQGVETTKFSMALYYFELPQNELLEI